MTDILVYTEEQDNVIAGSVEPREIVVAVVGEVGGGGGLVLSVNGQIGDVVLDADDVGADAAGAATSAVATHEAALDPHTQYTTVAEAAAAAPVQSVDGQTGAVSLSGSYAPLSHVGSGGTAHSAATTSVAGFMSATDKTKLDGVQPGATANANTDSLTEGTTNLYFAEPRVRATPLTGLSTATTGAVAATDTVLQAFGKLEKTKAPLASPEFTGAPTAPTATEGSNTTQLATTEFVQTAASSRVAQTITNGITTSAPSQDAVFDALVLKAPLTSPTFTGTPAAPTPAAGDNGTKIATTAFVQTALLTPVAAYAGTAKTLALTDVGTIVDCTSSSAVTITIPPQASVVWPDNTEIHVRMSGTGQVSIAVGSGVTVPPLTAPVALAGQGAVVTLKRRSADVWAIVGAATWMQPISTITGLQAELAHINITLAIGV